MNNQTDVFAVNNNGQLNVAWVLAGSPWSGPTTISPAGLFPPGAPLAASQQFGVPNQTDVFVVDKNGQLNVLWVLAGSPWSGPTTISPAGFAPGPGALVASQQYGVVAPSPPPVTANFGSGYLTCDQPLGGTLTISLDNSAGDGEATITGSFHNSGFDNINYTVTAVLLTPAPNLKAFTFQHSGSTQGTSGALPFGSPRRDDNFVIPTMANPLVAANWTDVLGATLTASVAATDELVLGLEGALNTVLNAALAAVGKKLGDFVGEAIIALL